MANEMPAWLSRLLCRIGVHDYRLVDEVLAFGCGRQRSESAVSAVRICHDSTRVAHGP